MDDETTATKDAERVLGLEIALILALRDKFVGNDAVRGSECRLDLPRIGQRSGFGGDIAVARIARCLADRQHV